MTHDRDIERLLDTWLADGPRETPDRVLDAVTSRIHRQHQRPAWRLTWRLTPMASLLKPLAAAIAVIALGLVGFSVLRPPTEVAGPSPVVPSPTATPTATPTPTPSESASTATSACELDRTCSGPLAAGNHTSGTFVVPFTFTTPEDWVNVVDIGRSYKLTTPAGVAPEIQVMTNLAIIDQNPACDPVVKKDVGTSVQEIIDYVTAHPGLSATAPVPARIGGYDGQSIDFTVASDWPMSCPGDPNTPQAMLLTDTGVPPQRAVGYTPDHRVRWVVLDVGGTTVLVELRGSSYSSTFKSGVAEVQPILDSIKFTPSN